MAELAVGLPFLVVILSGLFEFGVAFHTYHRLESAVRNACRYASISDYDSPDGSSFAAAVRNLAVYGSVRPGTGARPRIPGLGTSNIDVEVAKDGAGVPMRVTLAVTGFDIEVAWRTFRLAGKPSATFDYQGQYR